MRYLYSIFYTGYVILCSPAFLMNEKKRKSFMQRFALGPKLLFAKSNQSRIWIHAVSVGEVRLALQLIRALRVELNNFYPVLTVTTPSGLEIANESKGERLDVCYFPLDFTCVMKRFVQYVKPKMVIILETEIWPNMLTTLNNYNIPSMIVNGRISDKSWPKYRIVRHWVKPVINKLTKCLAQSDKDAGRFIGLGLEASKVCVMGNMKYDILKPSVDATLKEAIDAYRISSVHKVMLCASTHFNEEEQIMSAYMNSSHIKSDLQLFVAPRHIDRADDIAKQCLSLNLRPVLYSEWIKTEKSKPTHPDSVLILDLWGVLSTAYLAVDYIFVGGSLVPHGGHNLAEAAVCLKPVLHGPHMKNFKEMATKFSDNNAALEIRDANDLMLQISSLMSEAKKSNDLVNNAKQTVQDNQGAIQIGVKEIKKCLYKS